MATTFNSANTDVPIKKIDIQYLIDAAEKIYIQDFDSISYMLLKEAQKTLEKLKMQGSTEYTEDLESRICKGLSLITLKDPPDEYARKTTIGKLVLFYSKYEENYKISTILREEEKKHKEWAIFSANFHLEQGFTIEDILTTSKAMRTALKMLTRVARGNTPEQVFIRENEIPEEFLEETEYDEEESNETYNAISSDGRTDRLPAEANMDVPISKIDIGYLIDAAEKIFIQDYYYISYMLLTEAKKTLKTLKEQGSAEYTEDLESRIRNILSDMTVNDPPYGYAGKTTIEKLVLSCSEYKEKYKIDGLREEEKKHKEWAIFSAYFHRNQGFTIEDTLTTSKAMRTALKMLTRLERGDTSEKDFIRENEIPEEFLHDTEYEGSDESQATTLSQGLETMTIDDPNWGMDLDWYMDTDASSHLADSTG